MTFGDVTIWPTTFKPVIFVRTPRLIRTSDPETVHLSLPLKGTLRGKHGDHEVASGPDNFFLLDSSRPLRVWSGNGDLAHTGIGMEIPKVMLSLDQDKINALMSHQLSARTGFGCLLAHFLRRTARDVDSYKVSDGRRLSTLAVDLVSALFAHALDDRRSLTPETHRRTLVLRVRAFILQHLHDPALTPPMIAAAHHISISYLHRLFQEEEDTVSSFIRRERLERVRRSLTATTSSRQSIQHIAANWGFDQYVSFTRAFRSY
ncbi:helix-turn-helix domain-containing protein, partial [Amycolatopsis sp. KNN50.9b]|uniref:AraC-like ligand-binding domain-containing protein n=1 Tax=Amycolatopsis sp. KNN50.9b TaxID=2018303 RepID=UPI001E5B20E0